MRLKTTLLAGALLAAFVGAAQATVLPYKSLDRLVKEADGIVIGTVRNVQTVSGAKAHDIHTYVTIDALQVLNGKLSEDALTLRIKGGFDGQRGLHIDGAPNFKVDERVLMFVQGNGRDLVPFVGWSQGVFRVIEEAGGARFISDAEGNAIVGVEGGHLLRKAGEHLDSHIVGAPDVVRQRAAAPQASGGVSEDGIEAVTLDVRAAAQAPLAVDRFLAEIRRRTTMVAGKPLRSVTPQDVMVADAADEAPDRMPGVAAQAQHDVAQPEGGAVMLPRRKPLNATPQQ